MEPAIHGAGEHSSISRFARGDGTVTLERLYDSCPVGLAFVDRDLRIRRINHALAGMNGVPAALHVGRTLRETLPDLAERLEPIYRQVLDTGETVANVEIAGETPAQPGRVRHWLGTYAPVHGPNGEVVGVNVAVQETTEQRSRQEAEQALAAREVASRALAEKLQLALDASCTGLWDWNVETDVSEWSPETYRLLGLPNEARPRTGAEFLSLVHPEDASRVKAGLRAAIERRELYDCEYRLVRPDGAVVWAHDRARAQYDAAGRPVRVLGSISDVTARKEAELEAERTRTLLAEQYAQLDSIYANAPVGLCVFDRDLRFVRINERLAEINGLPVEAHLGRTVAETVPNLLPVAESLLRRVLDTGEPVLDIEIVGETPAKPGVQRTWIESWYPIRDGAGAIVAVGVVAVEVTAQRAATAEILRQRAELQTILDVVPIGISIAHDPRGDLITSSPGFARRLGLDPNGNVSITGPAGPTGFECYANGRLLAGEDLPMQRVARTGEPLHDFEYELRLPDGRQMTMICNVAPLYDVDGRVRGAVGAHVDVTSLKRVQESLERADRHKDEFLAMLAHELRNPLAPIRYASAVLSRPDASGAVAQQLVPMIERQVVHMTRLVEDLLDVSRITQNRITLRREVLAVANVIAEAAEANAPAAVAKGQSVVVAPIDGTLAVNGDRARLVQCVVNLLANACKYSGTGARIDVSAARDGRQCAIRVRDPGAGIPADLLPHVFELFVQSDHTLDRSEGGLGIGLAVVRRLVEMHGGSVAVESDGVGHGAVFTIRLPLVPAATEVATVERVSVAPRRVVVVDDHEDCASALSLMLRLEGHEVLTTRSASEALAKAPGFAPDVVILDIGLPGMNGYLLAREFRAHPEMAAARLVALTGYGQSEDKRRALAAGFDQHLTKPVDPQQLATALDGSGQVA